MHYVVASRGLRRLFWPRFASACPSVEDRTLFITAISNINVCAYPFILTVAETNVEFRVASCLARRARSVE